MRLSTPFSDLDYVTPDAPLAPLTWYRIGGPAQWLIRPRNVEELREATRRCSEGNIPIYVLGLGANLLVSDDGVPGAVFRLDDPAWQSIDIDGTTVKLGAGFDMQKMVLRCCREGLAGVECMAGIYGTVGGGVRMNAGGRYGNLGNNVSRVTVMSAAGEVFERTADDLHFGYRSTNIVAPFILSAELELETEDPQAVTDRTKEVWMYKRSTQPLNAKSSGCMFTNPGTLPDGRQASAGKLIDDAGLKGMRVGNAEVSVKHANFILAHAPCTAHDVTELVRVVREKVQEKFDVDLRTEVKFWPA